MPRTSFRQFATASLASALLAVSLPVIASAQTAPPSQWLRFTVDTVKPDMVQEYEGYKKQLAAAYKKAGQPIYAVLTNFAGQPERIHDRDFVMKFGDMDGPNPVAKAMGEEAFANLVRWREPLRDVVNPLLFAAVGRPHHRQSRLDGPVLPADAGPHCDRQERGLPGVSEERPEARPGERRRHVVSRLGIRCSAVRPGRSRPCGC